MDNGEGEATQPGDAAQAGAEELQRLADELEAAQGQEMDLIDTALAQAEDASTREGAVAALIRATVGINALYASTAVAPPLEIPFPHSYYAWRPHLPYPDFLRLHRQPRDIERRDKLVEKYMKVADRLVERYKPDQYQLSVGFPLLVSVTLVWNLKE